MAGRSHLSIGEVLSLLQDEFPDVTISKIRFLESQGLVDPERTPSGYRKFYESDIERLRWVLRQQRDAFLPLKVIKGRLDHQPELDDDEPEEAPDIELELVQVEVISGPDTAAGELGPETEAAPEPTADPVTGAGQTGAAVQRGGPGEAEDLVSGPGPQLFDTGPPLGGYVEPAEPEERGALHRRTPAGQPDGGGLATTAGARQGGRNSHRRPDGTRANREEKVVAAHRAGGARAAAPGRAGTGRAGTGRAGTGPGVEGTAAGQELTLEELIEETGADVETVRELEAFALVTHKVIGGARYYTQEAATVTRLAAAFARHGVEARHLRAYKGAADREAGLVEQVIMPLIRQRNPEAREAAAQAVEELSTLGGELRAALLRSALANLH
ncbi:MAG TPA: MerR family transcriptional regulator [Acidimicrobiales bacterium]|nr:MerR family transcriptional regulator [Acidimicrobiales bacterium]